MTRTEQGSLARMSNQQDAIICFRAEEPEFLEGSEHRVSFTAFRNGTAYNILIIFLVIEREYADDASPDEPEEENWKYLEEPKYETHVRITWPDGYIDVSAGPQTAEGSIEWWKEPEEYDKAETMASFMIEEEFQYLREPLASCLVLFRESNLPFIP